jgi:hypothetical protein
MKSTLILVCLIVYVNCLELIFPDRPYCISPFVPRNEFDLVKFSSFITLLSKVDKYTERVCEKTSGLILVLGEDLREARIAVDTQRELEFIKGEFLKLTSSLEDIFEHLIMKNLAVIVDKDDCKMNE